MFPLAVVTIVVDGSIVSSSAPVRIAGGRVISPLEPIVARLASKFTYEPDGRTLLVRRGARHSVVPLLSIDSTPYVAIGPLVRALGGTITFDARSRTLSIGFAYDAAIATPAPFDRNAPQVSPKAVFAVPPLPAVPRAVESDFAHPRRTAIPAVPSQPGPPAPNLRPTSPPSLRS